MARNDTTNPLGVTNVKKGSRAGSGGTGNAPNLDIHALSIETMRTRLSAVSASTWTPARLDNMTKNDMLYALRTLEDGANIK